MPRGQYEGSIFGVAGFDSGWSDHQSRPAREEVEKANGSIGLVPHFAPSSIHFLRIAF